MAQEQKPQSQPQQQQQLEHTSGRASPPALTPEDVKLRLKYFGAGAVPTTLLFTYMSQGQFGASAALGTILGGTAAYFAPEIHSALGYPLHLCHELVGFAGRNHSGHARHRLMDKNWWLTGEASIQYAEEEVDNQRQEDEEIRANGKQGAQEKQEGPWVPPQFILEDVLDVILAFNKKGYVYFGESEEGAIAIPLNQMYHVMDVSSSGKGKSNRFRLAMMQIVNSSDTYYINPLAAEVKAVTDNREIEVWKPIYDRLANKRPMKKGPEIKDLMTSLVNEITERNAQEEERDFSWQQQPIFVFIDELPEVFARCPDAIKLLDKIGRMGRQYCVFCWIASQTANVKDCGLSTPAQAQCKTRIYGGGDKTSADRMMKGHIPANTERILQSSGAGLTLMLADGMDGCTFVRAPLVTNEALFDYFELPLFCKEDWLKSKKAAPTIRLIDDEEEEHHPSSQEPAEATRKLPDDQATERAATAHPHLREVSRKSARAANPRHPTAGLPRIIQTAYEAYEPGMTYRELGTALGYGNREAREVFQELKRRGLLHAPVVVTERVEATQAHELHLRQVPRSETPQGEDREQRAIDPADLAKAFALWQAGASSVRKLEAAAKTARYDWSNRKVRVIIDEMEDRQLIQKREPGVM